LIAVRVKKDIGTKARVKTATAQIDEVVTSKIHIFDYQTKFE